ncbi:MAG TPA: dNTP triphosphohydrolase, partial [candidate division Zixibacteria bacterium]|nr:dNTP triphosphohydrolase [candidate division Zixibacteria bacterium]
MEPILTREEIEQRERATLAPYAALAAESRGRRFPSRDHPLRTVFQRDRDRVVHAAAFRRLEYKTQVFIPHERDHFRTRLTHTIEVAQIARTLARSLRLNEDLAEAIALAHDLGHTPFGHSGEDVLKDLLAGFGGFNHNRQTLRIVDLLEQRYPEHPGLNLTYEVREGIVKHETVWDHKVAEFDDHAHPTLEAALVDVADELAYNAHDIDDGLSAGMLAFDDLCRQPVWEVFGLDGRGAFERLHEDQKRYALVRR